MTVRLTRCAALVVVSVLIAVPATAQSAREGAERNYDAVKAMLLSYPQETVREAQRATADDGYYRGAIDGRLNPSTERAIETFQRAHGIPPDGKLNATTLNLLRQEVGAASPRSTQDDTPPNTRMHRPR